MFHLGSFGRDAADYTIRTGENNRDYVRIHVSDRNPAGREQFITPAQVNSIPRRSLFTLEVTDNDTKQAAKCNGTEWHSPGHGIVRAEIANQNGTPPDYSEITELSGII